MTTYPCKFCENKGCGAYHDKCEKYQNYVSIRKAEKAKELMPERRTKRKTHFNRYLDYIIIDGVKVLRKR